MNSTEAGAAKHARPEARPRRGWAWIALIAAVFLWLAAVVTFGAAVIFSPIGFALSVVAWRRSSTQDGVFWLGFALNALLFLGFLDLIRGLLTGDVSISGGVTVIRKERL